MQQVRGGGGPSLASALRSLKYLGSAIGRVFCTRAISGTPQGYVAAVFVALALTLVMP